MRDTVAYVEEIVVPTGAGPTEPRVVISGLDGTIRFYGAGGILVGEASPDNGFIQYATDGAYAQLWAPGTGGAFLILGPEDFPTHTTTPAFVSGDIDFTRESGRIVMRPPTVDGLGELRVFMNGESVGGDIPNLVIDGGFGLPADFRLNDLSLGRGYYLDTVSSGASAAMAIAGQRYPVPGTLTTLTNDLGVTRRYLVLGMARFNMSAGGPGLYRACITDNAAPPADVGTFNLNQQNETTTVGGPGQVSSVAFALVTLAAGASQAVQVSGIRIAGGAAGDTAVSGGMIVIDIGG